MKKSLPLEQFNSLYKRGPILKQSSKRTTIYQGIARKTLEKIIVKVIEFDPESIEKSRKAFQHEIKMMRAVQGDKEGEPATKTEKDAKISKKEKAETTPKARSGSSSSSFFRNPLLKLVSNHEKVKLEKNETVVKKSLVRENESTKKETTDKTERINKECSTRGCDCEPEYSHVVRLYDSFEGETEGWLVMEYCEMGDLLDYVFNNKVYGGGLLEEDARKVFVQALMAVSSAHKRSIIHRDIKLENLFVAREKGTGYAKIKLGDWGLAAHKSLKKSQTPAGTLEYIAPEALGYKEVLVTEELDMWSMGVMLFALATGRLPFKGENSQQTVSLIKSWDITFPAGISSELKSLIAGLLNRNHKKRFTMEKVMRSMWLQGKSTLPRYLRTTNFQAFAEIRRINLNQSETESNDKSSSSHELSQSSDSEDAPSIQKLLHITPLSNSMCQKDSTLPTNQIMHCAIAV